MNYEGMGKKLAMTAAILSAGLVGFGAFGAHAIANSIGPAAMDTYKIGVAYAQWHLLALLVSGLIHWKFSAPAALQAAWGFLVGVILFSGSLMVLAVTGWTILGALAPFGGLFLIASWLFLARAIASLKPTGGETA